MKKGIQIRTELGGLGGWITEAKLDDTVVLSIVMNSNRQFATHLKVDWGCQVGGDDFEDTLRNTIDFIKEMMIEMVEDCERLKVLNIEGVLYKEFRPMEEKG